MAGKPFGAASFSDDDSEDEISNKVKLRVQESTNLAYRALNDFLGTPEYNNNQGDPTTTIVDRHTSKCYKIPDSKIPKFFKLLEMCREAGIRQMKYEKQLEYSGIMIDFDIKQTTEKRVVSDLHKHMLCMKVVHLLAEHLDFPQKKFDIICGFTTKPRPVLIDENIDDQFKDGFHMLIPGVKTSREFKRFLVYELMCEMEAIFHDVPIIEDGEYTRDKILDENSSHVGVHFVGNATKMKSPPYQLTDIYRNSVVIREGGIDIMPAKEVFPPGTNLSYEFSLNWQKSPEKGGIIRKAIVLPRASSQHKIDAYKAPKREVEEEFNHQHNALSVLNLHDPDSDFIRQLLDILHPDRYEEYGLWFQVLCALAHTSLDYMPLADYFSQKSDKYSEADFNRTWLEACKRGNNNLSVGSIHYWAKQDNEARYFEVKKRDVHTMLYEMVYSLENEGCLEHYDIAKLLHRMTKGKYVYSMEEGVYIGTWFEYVLEEDPRRQGELFKWRKFVRQRPTSMSRYISEAMPVMFRSVLGKIKEKYESSEGGLAKYHAQIFKNFQRTCKQLKNSSFKKGVMTEAEALFHDVGFADKLDKDPNLLGVGNGVLKLGKKVELLTGAHGYLVSKFTEINWIPFNPYNPMTAKVIKVFRSLFPDGEPDTHYWFMHFLASSLDGHIKDSVFGASTGSGSNGKTMLTEMHKGALGSMYAVKMPMEFLTKGSGNADSATPALMQLISARFAYYSESSRGNVLNEARIKEVTGQETLSGRRLHQDMINFKPTCHHYAGSNYEFEIHGTDHGIWRRIKYIRMKMRFVDPTQEKIDTNNPFEREADLSLGKEWVSDSEVLSSYLSFLTFMYESLVRNYGSNLMKIPHPNIKHDTAVFRAKQDRMSHFFGVYLVKTDDDTECTLDEMAKKYTTWHRVKYPDNKSFQSGLNDQLLNSAISKLWKTRKNTKYLVGYRILDHGEEKDDHEKHFSTGKAEKRVAVKPETVDEYYARICHEFDAACEGKESPAEAAAVSAAAVAAAAAAAAADSESDSDIEEDLKRMKRRPLAKKNVEYDPSQVNLADRMKMIERLGHGSDSDSESDASDASESEG